MAESKVLLWDDIKNRPKRHDNSASTTVDVSFRNISCNNGGQLTAASGKLVVQGTANNATAFASLLGVDSSTIRNSASADLQSVLEDLDLALVGSVQQTSQAIAAGDVLTFVSPGKVAKASASGSLDNGSVFGVALEAGILGAYIAVFTSEGLVAPYPPGGLVVGATYYLSDTVPGTLTSSPDSIALGSTVYAVGKATATSAIRLSSQLLYVR